MCRFPISYGINRINKTMADKLVFIPNDDTQKVTRLQLVFEQFGYSTLLFNNSPQSC